jgi:hypothetical protein
MELTIGKAIHNENSNKFLVRSVIYDGLIKLSTAPSLRGTDFLKILDFDICYQKESCLCSIGNS